MLRLPEGQKVFAPQDVVTHRVTTAADGRPWSASIGSEVVLLGDSFTNIYSDSSLGWGASAGFAEHLSLALGLPIDVVAINGGGADAARAEIAGPGGRERLERARVVVYEFADRDLTTENWKVIPIPPAPIRTAPVAESAPPAAGTPSEPERPAAPAAPAGPQAGARPTAVPTVLGPPDRGPGRADRPPGARAADFPRAGPLQRPVRRLPLDRPPRGARRGVGPLVRPLRDRRLPRDEGQRVAPARELHRRSTLLKVRLVPFREAGPEIRSIRRVDDLDDLERIPYYAVKWEIE